MSSEDLLKVGARYNFQVHATAVLGTFKDVRVDGVVDVSIASNFIDPYSLHANIFGSLPEGSVENDASKYHYVLLTLPNGSKTALGIPWIIQDSIEKKEHYQAQVYINNVSPGDTDKIKRALISNGFDVASVTIN